MILSRESCVRVRLIFDVVDWPSAKRIEVGAEVETLAMSTIW
jgi:hypothetical protein